MTSSPKPNSSAKNPSSRRQNGDSLFRYLESNLRPAIAGSLTVPPAGGKLAILAPVPRAAGVGKSMRKLWWPEALYEMKPFGALMIGLLAALVGAAGSWAERDWQGGFAAVLLLALAGFAYAAAVLGMRYRYRSRSRWNRERRN
jgi:hypothetical protein